MSIPVAFAFIGVFGTLFYLLYTDYKQIEDIK